MPCSRSKVITGVAPAEYGDKSRLVVHVVTKSGLASKPAGEALYNFLSTFSGTISSRRARIRCRLA